MASLFSKDPTARAPLPPYAIERIAQEIAHLRKRGSVRHGQKDIGSFNNFVCAVALCSLLWLYFMDPFLYAFHKNDAIQAYLYLHNYDSEQKAMALINTGILSPAEANALNRRHGAFQDYFSSPLQAEQAAATIANYMNGLTYLYTGQYELLDPIGKLRYLLFVQTGLVPPTVWTALCPSVEQ